VVAQDLITGAMRLFEGVEAGGTPSTSELADGLVALQQLLDAWSADELLIFATATASVTLSSGTRAYALVTRPAKILGADLLVSGINSPVEVVGPEHWATVTDKNSTSPQPRFVYCDYGYPTANVTVAPVPSASSVLNLYNLVDLATLASVGSTFAMPEAYARALRYNLAIDFAPEFGATLLPTVIQTAADSKAQLRKLIASNAAGKSALAVPPVPAPQGE
jgi:hypothetical protein